jgi:hypothetical protein
MEAPDPLFIKTLSRILFVSIRRREIILISLKFMHAFFEIILIVRFINKILLFSKRAANFLP